MQKDTFFESLIWIGAILILLWAILKAFGVLHSPVWVEMIPYVGGGLSILGISYGLTYKLGKIKKGIEQTEEKVNKIVAIEERFNKLEYEHSLAMKGKLDIKHN